MIDDRIQNQYEQTSNRTDTDNHEAFDQGHDSSDQVKDQLKATWTRLNDEDIDLYNDDREQFFYKLEEKYGLVREEAESRLKEIEDSCASCGEKAA
jgi:hypothetical protein